MLPHPHPALLVFEPVRVRQLPISLQPLPSLVGTPDDLALTYLQRPPTPLARPGMLPGRLLILAPLSLAERSHGSIVPLLPAVVVHLGAAELLLGLIVRAPLSSHCAPSASASQHHALCAPILDDPLHNPPNLDLILREHPTILVPLHSILA